MPSATSTRRRPKRKAAEQPAAETNRTDAARDTQGAAAGARARVRMYRQGLGDCFLVTLPRTGADASRGDYHIMIDCGVILGTPDAAQKMTKVVEDIVKTTDGEVDLLIVTHEHWDHLSGFVQAADAFKKLKVHEVWLAWTEDPSDNLATRLREERNSALTALQMSMNRMFLAGDADGAEEIAGLVGFFGAAKGGTTKDALEIVRKLAPPPRYCLPQDAPVKPAGTDVRLYVLGPPHDEKLLKKINPSTRAPETYGLALEVFRASAQSALAGDDLERPFGTLQEIPFAVASEMDFFKSLYWRPETADDDWRRIDTAWLGGSSELALALDSMTNNTSLVLAIELADGDVLLFAADAQVGNWLSWQDLKWTVGTSPVTGPDLLKRAIFYKVGHHGSHNATLREKGLEMMDRLRVAMVPVDEEMAKKKRWGHMPLTELLDALQAKTKGAVLRADKAPPKIEDRLIAEELFFELIV